MPDAVLDALARGNTIDAIKLLRDASGLGLKEAKAVIDAQSRTRANAARPARPPAPAATAPTGPLPASIADALQRGRTIEAIKLLRQHSGLGLKEAKEAIDSMAAHRAAPKPGDLSPGEVPRRGGLIWKLVLAAVVVAAGWLMFRAG